MAKTEDAKTEIKEMAWTKVTTESQTAKWGCGICGARSFVLFLTFKNHLKEAHGWVVEVKAFHAKVEE